MTSLAAAILLVATTAAATPETDPLFETPTACAVEPIGELRSPDPLSGPDVPLVSSEHRSLRLAAESRVRDDDPSRPLLAQVDRPATSSWFSRFRLESPGRAWPFALAATADAASTYWALRRGGAEGNPLLGPGRLDIAMVKMAQFPIIAKAVDMVEARNPRLGRRLRWTALVFHAVLAANNVRVGHFAAQRERMARASGTP
jgi:hypothetical protein